MWLDTGSGKLRKLKVETSPTQRKVCLWVLYLLMFCMEEVAGLFFFGGGGSPTILNMGDGTFGKDSEVFQYNTCSVAFASEIHFVK